jgi:hypothetical protein
MDASVLERRTIATLGPAEHAARDGWHRFRQVGVGRAVDQNILGGMKTQITPIPP